MADGGTIDLGDGVTLAPSTEADFAHIAANLRPGDRSEQEVFGPLKPEAVRAYEDCLTFRFDGEICGFVGCMPFDGETGASRRRYVSMLTTGAVERNRVRFVKATRRGFAVLLRRMPSWVERACVLTRDDYAGAMRWIRRTIRMRETAHLEIGGIAHTVWSIERGK